MCCKNTIMTGFLCCIKTIMAGYCVLLYQGCRDWGLVLNQVCHGGLGDGVLYQDCRYRVTALYQDCHDWITVLYQDCNGRTTVLYQGFVAGLLCCIRVLWLDYSAVSGFCGWTTLLYQGFVAGLLCCIRVLWLDYSAVSGPRLNIKTVLSTYGDFHVKDKTAVRTSYL